MTPWNDGRDSRPNEDRARVPFALVGVVLLLGSVAYVHGVALQGTVDRSYATDVALDRAEATSRAAIRAGVRRAARWAVRHPVVDPADTPAGRALDDDHPFRDALRLRAYLAVADGLRRASVTEGGVTATSALPRVDSAADLPAAIERVRVRSVASGTAIRVTVVNVTTTARRGGRTLARTNSNVSVTVALPALALHRRVTSYERRLNRGPTGGPGLGRQLTARLTAVAAARGLAQYGGVGIANVVANRHVELSANGGALRLQRAVFGRADPDGRAALLRATTRVGLTDLVLDGYGVDNPWAAAVLGEGRSETAAIATLAPSPRRRTVAVGVNHTADEAFVRFLSEDFDRVLTGSYRATVTRRVRVVAREEGTRPPLDAPGANWTLAGRNRTVSHRIVDRSSPSSPSERTADRSGDDRTEGNQATFVRAARTVRVTHVERRLWTNGSATREREVTWGDRVRVRVTVRGEYAPDAPGPARPVRPLFERGGALDGPNLVDVPRHAAADFPASASHLDALARSAVREGGQADRLVSVGTRPSDLRRWAYRDVVALRERLRNLTVEVSHRAVATGGANAPAALAAAVRARRADLLDPPATYDGVADRARVAARAAYLDRVIARLESRAAAARTRNGGLGRVLREAAGTVGTNVRTATRAAADVVAPSPEPLGDGPAGRVVLVPDADPSYLTLTAVGDRLTESVPAGERVHPLAARNRNVFAVPFGDAAAAVTDTLLADSRRVPLGTAGRALVAANRTFSDRLVGPGEADADDSGLSPTNDTVRRLRRRRDRLRGKLRSELRAVDRRVADVLAARVDGLTDADRVRILAAARERYVGVGARARAVANGSYAGTVAAVVADGYGLNHLTRDRLEVRLRVAIRDLRADESVTVPAETVNATVSARRRVVRLGLETLAAEAASAGVDRLRGRLRERLGKGALGLTVAGFPVAPVPGYWYATVNVWVIEVRGEYPTFAVTARLGSASDAPVLRYVREDAPVELDVDGDGDAELLGHDRALSFNASAVAFAVVPPGRGGVGDVDGTVDERSAGWACPGGPACGRVGNESSVGPRPG